MIIAAIVAARLVRIAFWQDFWFEHAVGFAFGWFVFPYEAMRRMAGSPLIALWMAARAEFFSMTRLLRLPRCL